MNRPNILWIFIEDQDPRYGCYGEELVSTPDIDALACSLAGHSLLRCKARGARLELFGQSLDWSSSRPYRLDLRSGYAWEGLVSATAEW